MWRIHGGQPYLGVDVAAADLYLTTCILAHSQSSGLAGTGLGLGDDVSAFDDGHDSTLLDSRWLLETVGLAGKFAERWRKYREMSDIELPQPTDGCSFPSALSRSSDTSCCVPTLSLSIRVGPAVFTYPYYSKWSRGRQECGADVSQPGFPARDSLCKPAVSTHCVDTTEELWLKLHGIEVVDDL